MGTFWLQHSRKPRDFQGNHVSLTDTVQIQNLPIQLHRLCWPFHADLTDGERILSRKVIRYRLYDTKPEN